VCGDAASGNAASGDAIGGGGTMTSADGCEGGTAEPPRPVEIVPPASVDVGGDSLSSSSRVGCSGSSGVSPRLHPLAALKVGERSASSASIDAAAIEPATPSHDLSLSPLRQEMVTLESRHAELQGAHEALLASVRVAMSCLPPPGPIKTDPKEKRPSVSATASSAASSVASSASTSPAGSGAASEGASTAKSPSGMGGPASPAEIALAGKEGRHEGGKVGAEAMATASDSAMVAASGVETGCGSALSAVADEAGASGGGSSVLAEDSQIASQLAAIRRVGSDLCSSARQAAHANARLGHSMATEREQLKAALTQAQKRISYLSADVNARLLFAAQPAKHASGSSTLAFAALMLPTLSSGLPSHWLSPESVESLRRWCEDESMPMSALRYVIGRVVHVAGPFEVPAGAGLASSGSISSTSMLAADTDAPQDNNPFRLPAGEQYCVVHAEMMLQHRWT